MLRWHSTWWCLVHNRCWCTVRQRPRWVIVDRGSSQRPLPTWQLRTRGRLSWWKLGRFWLYLCHTHHLRTITNPSLYEGRSINKLQNGAIPLILKIGKIQNIHFVGNLILNIRKRNFLDDDVIIVTSSGDRIVYLCIIYSTSFLSQLLNSTETKITNKLNKLMLAD